MTPKKGVDCVGELQAVADALAHAGASPTLIVASLAHVAIKTAERDCKHAASCLDSAAVILSAAAEIARSRHVCAQADQVFKDTQKRS